MKSSRQPSRESAQRYVDILSDAGFKAVFGDRRNKDVLIDLLNVVLPPHRRVRDLSYMTTELPQFSPLSKGVRLDLRCSAHDGTVFIVEVDERRGRKSRQSYQYVDVLTGTVELFDPESGEHLFTPLGNQLEEH